MVASIFDFHVNTNGWQDIGYNWLIDPNGVLYEGRGGGENVRGAHMCGYNNNTLGVCVMGNFVSLIPSDTAIISLKTTCMEVLSG
ncbi:MAG: N-acetylmuramoyl-L-alanine amidase [Saprospiraceae bacterium]|nr:N-acetylmuramoyl-L-alanine amidase [Saprospiraceae bacterium]